jgi:hypothetical protein
MGGPDFADIDFSVHRQFNIGTACGCQFRAEVFNLTNAPHFGNPSGNGVNVFQLQLNPNGTVRNLGAFSSITTTANSGRDGIDERVIRLGSGEASRKRKERKEGRRLDKPPAAPYDCGTRRFA